MTYSNDYDEYDDEYETEEADPPARPRMATRRRETPIAQQAFDWGISGSIIAILILTALYAFSPIDLVPDVIPIAGQVDDIAAILAGGGSITFLTIIRYVLRSRVGRWGCLLVIVLTSIGAFAVFWVLMRLLDMVV